MKGNNVTLQELIEIATPFDPSSHSKQFFLERITPDLEKQFSEQYTEEFENLITERGVYFITDFSTRRVYTKPKIKLSLCGKENLPTISINFEVRSLL